MFMKLAAYSLLVEFNEISGIWKKIQRTWEFFFHIKKNNFQKENSRFVFECEKKILWKILALLIFLSSIKIVFKIH